MIHVPTTMRSVSLCYSAVRGASVDPRSLGAGVLQWEEVFGEIPGLRVRVEARITNSGEAIYGQFVPNNRTPPGKFAMEVYGSGALKRANTVGRKVLSALWFFIFT